MSPLQQLFEFLTRQPRQPFEIGPRVDTRRYLARKFAPELPFLLKQYSFPKYRSMVGSNWMHWHEYFELILPVRGRGQFQIGDQIVQFAPGDLLVVDNLKLHGVSRLAEPHESLVIFFPTEAIAAPGGNSSDHAFLAPLCGRPEDVPPLMRSSAKSASRMHDSVLKLVESYFSTASMLDRYVECKLHLLELLHLLREHFGLRQDFREELQKRQQRHARLQNVFEFLAAHYSEPLTQPEIAIVAGMSTSRFRDFFKQTTGCTFVEYLRDLRLSKAAQLLRESAANIAQIAAETGFSDQSYLHRCFKLRYGVAPLEYRRSGSRIE